MTALNLGQIQDRIHDLGRNDGHYGHLVVGELP
jgi:hypothetical protein